jgi:hypothetical protein
VPDRSAGGLEVLGDHLGAGQEPTVGVRRDRTRPTATG